MNSQKKSDSDYEATLIILKHKYNNTIVYPTTKIYKEDMLNDLIQFDYQQLYQVKKEYNLNRLYQLDAFNHHYEKKDIPINLNVNHFRNSLPIINDRYMKDLNIHFIKPTNKEYDISKNKVEYQYSSFHLNPFEVNKLLPFRVQFHRNIYHEKFIEYTKSFVDQKENLSFYIVDTNELKKRKTDKIIFDKQGYFLESKDFITGFHYIGKHYKFNNEFYSLNKGFSKFNDNLDFRFDITHTKIMHDIAYIKFNTFHLNESLYDFSQTFNSSKLLPQVYQKILYEYHENKLNYRNLNNYNLNKNFIAYQNNDIQIHIDQSKPIDLNIKQVDTISIDDPIINIQYSIKDSKVNYTNFNYQSTDKYHFDKGMYQLENIDILTLWKEYF